MAWRMNGQMIELCSCKMLCPCFFGPATPDQGWCAGSLIFDIRQGNSDGVNLGGREVAFVINLPGDFFSGNGTVRLYIDEGANPAQRRELEAIFQGKKGGPWEVVSGLVTKWLPTQYTGIDFQMGDNPTVSVADFGQVKLQRVKTEDGQQSKVENAPALVAFGIQTVDLARSDGSHWFDPEMRPWVSGGSGSISEFNWNA